MARRGATAILAMFLCAAWGTAALADGEAFPVVVKLRESGGRLVQGEVRGHRLRIDQPKEWGGGDEAPTPPETLAFALGACVVSTARLVAMLEGVETGAIGATVSGAIDFSKALGKPDAEGRAGYQGLTVRLTLDGPMSEAQKRAFLQRVAARCPLCDNLANQTPLTVELARP